MNPLEAFADAIQDFEGWRPGSMSNRNRNPGNLEHPNGEKIVYASLLDGYKALVDDLRAKFTGNNTHGLDPQSTVLNLFEVYAPSSDNNPTRRYAVFVANWATIALKREITLNTKLGEIYSEQVPAT